MGKRNRRVRYRKALGESAGTGELKEGRVGQGAEGGLGGSSGAGEV
jgi:hypothetical protein